MRRNLPLILFVLAVPLLAQQPPTNPQAPTLALLPQMGLPRGTTAELVLNGTNLLEITGLWSSFGGKWSVVENKTPTQAKVKLEVPKDAPLGFHFVRVATKRGLSNARVFCIDDLPQVVEVGTNRDWKTAQPVALPAVVVGQLHAEQTGYFKITVKAGQRVSFEVLGRRLGSPIDPQLTLYDATGRELPNGFSNDAPGLQTDSRLTLTFDKAGDYLVAVRDVSYRGGPEYVYRLRMGDFPCATTAIPLAVRRGTKARLRFAGPQVEGVAPVELDVPAQADAVQVTPRGPNGLAGWPVIVPTSDLEELVEQEPNPTPAQAQRLAIGSAVSGRFTKKDEIDHYVFTAKKGQRLIIEAHTLEYGSPADVVLTLKDAKGVQLAASNPANSPRLDYTAPADGDYTVVVEHLHAWGGPDETYRLSLTSFHNDFSLTLPSDRFDVAPGGEVGIPLLVTRTGYDGPIEVSVVGPKGVSGSLKIEGPPKPPNQPAGTLIVKVDELPSGPYDLRIVGKATVDGVAVERLASVRGLLQASMANLTLPPRTQFHQVGLAVTVKPPFRLMAKAMGEAQPGKPLKVLFEIARQADFKGEVVVGFAPPPPGGFNLPPVKIPGDKNAAEANLMIPGGAKPGPLSLNFQGTAKHAGRDWAVKAATLDIMVKK
ncbi:MAG: PPC domain-containing protein [Gemmataceae bacterium]